MRKMRPRMGKEQWASIIEQQSESELSIEVFCQERDIGLASFAKWKRRLSSAGKPSASSQQSSDFKQVHLAEPTEQLVTSTVTLTLGVGMTLTITNANLWAVIGGRRRMFSFIDTQLIWESRLTV